MPMIYTFRIEDEKRRAAALKGLTEHQFEFTQDADGIHITTADGVTEPMAALLMEVIIHSMLEVPVKQWADEAEMMREYQQDLAALSFAPPISFRLTPLEAIAVVIGLQIFARDPAWFENVVRLVAVKTGLRLTSDLATTPAIAAVTKSRWDFPELLPGNYPAPPPPSPETVH
jgi:hypothetical protein